MTKREKLLEKARTDVIMRNHYGMTVQWSAEDELFIARAPQFPLLAAHGDTPEEAISELGVAIEAAIEIMQEDGLPVPEPQVLAVG